MLNKILLRVVISTAGALLGAAVGLSIRKLIPQGGMGFDALADALGALFLGASLGLILGFLASQFLERRAGWITAGFLVIAGIATFVVAARIPQNRGPKPPVVESFAPEFQVQLFSRIAPGQPGPPAGSATFPYRELRVSSTDRRLTSKGWGEPSERSYCHGPLEEHELEQFAAIAANLVDEDYTTCQATDSSSVFSLTIELKEQRNGSAGFALDCFANHESLNRFLRNFDQARARFLGTGQCHDENPKR